jgi:hypothetical protein
MRDRYRGVIDNYLRPIFGNLCPKHVGATISTATATTSATMSKRTVFIFGGISKGLLATNCLRQLSCKSRIESYKSWKEIQGQSTA